ncbi:TPA: hypothetical protein IYE67_003149 [Enterococcus faecium]|nr:hypothetical protein [Enterococcus faecium]
MAALDRIEEAYLRSEARYMEDQVGASPADFQQEVADEKKIRIELGRRIRQVLERGRVRQFYR